MLVREAHASKEPSPILLQESGIITEVSEEQDENASSKISSIPKCREVHLRSGAKSGLLSGIYKFSCQGKIPVLASLDLHKNKVFSVAGDQVDLPKAAAIAGCQQLIFLFSQVFGSQGLAPAAQEITSPHRTSSGRSGDGRPKPMPRSTIIWPSPESGRMAIICWIPGCRPCPFSTN